MNEILPVKATRLTNDNKLKMSTHSKNKFKCLSLKKNTPTTSKTNLKQCEVNLDDSFKNLNVHNSSDLEIIEAELPLIIIDNDSFEDNTNGKDEQVESCNQSIKSSSDKESSNSSDSLTGNPNNVISDRKKQSRRKLYNARECESSESDKENLSYASNSPRMSSLNFSLHRRRSYVKTLSTESLNSSQGSRESALSKDLSQVVLSPGKIASPVNLLTPSSNKNLKTPTFHTKSTERKSSEKCSINQIRKSYLAILDDLYGDAWKSIPTLFKNRINEENYSLDGVAKKLDFDDGDEKSDAVKSYRKSIDRYLNDFASKTVEDSANKEITAKPTNKRIGELIGRKNGKATVENSTNDSHVKKLSFMGSLADNVPTFRCDPEAMSFKNNFKSKKEELTARLFKQFNRVVFHEKLDVDMTVMWDPKLRSTAGTATNRLLKHHKKRHSSIKLSVKVVDTPQRARRALKAIPELLEISVCHNMEIHYKYSYKCTQCGYCIGRHSKSLDIEKKVCGYCRGRFEIIVNKKNKDGVVVSTPAKNLGANGFAQFVKENYGSAKKCGDTHAQVMKTLSAQYSAQKSGKS